MEFCNKTLAKSLRQRGHELPESSKTRYGLFIAAQNIENHPIPLTTDKEAREVLRVGLIIVNILMEQGLLQASSSKCDRLYLMGADSVTPARRHQLARAPPPVTSTGCDANVKLACRLWKFAKEKDHCFRTSIMQAADHIEKRPIQIQNLQQCFEISGIKTHLAKMIVTEVMGRSLRDDEEAFLEGAEGKRRKMQ